MLPMLQGLRRSVTPLVISAFAVGAVLGWLLRQAVSNASAFSKEGFIDASVGALVGGLFALLGGWLGSAYLGQLERTGERQRQRDEMLGSAVLTYTELAHNFALLALFAGSEDAVRLPINVSLATMPQVQTSLAQGLPMVLLVQLRAAYGVLEAAEGLVVRGRSVGALNEKERETLSRIAAQAKQAQDALEAYLKKEFNYSIPEMSQQEITGLARNTSMPKPKPEG